MWQECGEALLLPSRESREPCSQRTRKYAVPQCGPLGLLSTRPGSDRRSRSNSLASIAVYAIAASRLTNTTVFRCFPRSTTFTSPPPQSARQDWTGSPARSTSQAWRVTENKIIGESHIKKNWHTVGIESPNGATHATEELFRTHDFSDLSESNTSTLEAVATVRRCKIVFFPIPNGICMCRVCKLDEMSCRLLPTGKQGWKDSSNKSRNFCSLTRCGSAPLSWRRSHSLTLSSRSSFSMTSRTWYIPLLFSVRTWHLTTARTIGPTKTQCSTWWNLWTTSEMKTLRRVISTRSSWIHLCFVLHRTTCMTQPLATTFMKSLKSEVCKTAPEWLCWMTSRSRSRRASPLFKQTTCREFGSRRECRPEAKKRIFHWSESWRLRRIFCSRWRSRDSVVRRESSWTHIGKISQPEFASV